MNSNLPVEKTTLPSENDFFANYYESVTSIDSSKYDTVVAYFLSITKGDRNAAIALAATIVSISDQYKVDPMVILDDFKKFKGSNQSFKKSLIAFFNKNRRNTSKIGLEQTVTIPPSVIRNIRK